MKPLDINDVARKRGPAAVLHAFDNARTDEPVPIRAEPFVYRDPRTIPRRQWLYDQHYIRGYVP